MTKPQKRNDRLSLEACVDANMRRGEHLADQTAPNHACLRKARPAAEPLPVTFKWLAQLPPDVRPFHLLRQFPRVANAMATSWSYRENCRTVLYDLLIDKRGNRKGFPDDVLRELLALRRYFEKLGAS